MELTIKEREILLLLTFGHYVSEIQDLGSTLTEWSIVDEDKSNSYNCPSGPVLALHSLGLIRRRNPFSSVQPHTEHYEYKVTNSKLDEIKGLLWGDYSMPSIIEFLKLDPSLVENTRCHFYEDYAMDPDWTPTCSQEIGPCKYPKMRKSNFGWKCPHCGDMIGADGTRVLESPLNFLMYPELTRRKDISITRKQLRTYNK